MKGGWNPCKQSLLVEIVRCEVLMRVFGSQTAIYATGVGLGASKGKEIGKYADGYSGYVHMAQDAVGDLMILTSLFD